MNSSESGALLATRLNWMSSQPSWPGSVDRLSSLYVAKPRDQTCKPTGVGTRRHKSARKKKKNRYHWRLQRETRSVIPSTFRPVPELLSAKELVNDHDLGGESVSRRIGVGVSRGPSDHHANDSPAPGKIPPASACTTPNIGIPRMTSHQGRDRCEAQLCELLQGIDDRQ